MFLAKIVDLFPFAKHWLLFVVSRGVKSFPGGRGLWVDRGLDRKIRIFDMKFVDADLFSKAVIPTGFEPVTHSLEDCCSIQLSYGTIVTDIKPFSGTKVIQFRQICKRAAAYSAG